MEVCIDVEKYVLLNVPPLSPILQCRNHLVSRVDFRLECEYRQAVLLLVGLHLTVREDTCQSAAGVGPGQLSSFLEDSEDSPKWAFLHWCCCDGGSETSGDDCVYTYIFRIYIYVYIYMYTH